MFQSTRPRGARHGMLAADAGFASFNPRARAGRDLIVTAIDQVSDVSIHAPARGAT